MQLSELGSRGRTYNVLAGGLGHCPGGWAGWYAGPADFEFNFINTNGFPPLIFETYGGCDTTLLIMTPDNYSHFNDDGGENYNARINVPGPQAGRYLVFVGTFSETACPAGVRVRYR